MITEATSAAEPTRAAEINPEARQQKSQLQKQEQQKSQLLNQNHQQQSQQLKQ
jgi:hypothetical protein